MGSFLEQHLWESAQSVPLSALKSDETGIAEREFQQIFWEHVLLAREAALYRKVICRVEGGLLTGKVPTQVFSSTYSERFKSRLKRMRRQGNRMFGILGWDVLGIQECLHVWVCPVSQVGMLG